jgi:hypothetical protein
LQWKLANESKPDDILVDAASAGGSRRKQRAAASCMQRLPAFLRDFLAGSMLQPLPKEGIKWKWKP